MTLWLRNPDETIDWFLSHNPSGPGMCAQHSFHSIGGDKGQPPAWGAPNANAVVDKMRAAGELQTHDLWTPPRGSYVVWSYGNNGHAAISRGDGTMATTDPSNGKPTGIEDLDYPKKWGAHNGGKPTGWSTYYAGLYWRGDDDMPLTDDDLTAIAKRVVQALGDFKFNGEPQETDNGKNDNGAMRLRKIWEQGVKNNPNIP